jgi:hypothetical protein
LGINRITLYKKMSYGLTKKPSGKRSRSRFKIGFPADAT